MPDAPPAQAPDALPAHRLVTAQVATACYLVVPFASVMTIALGAKGRGAAHFVAGLGLAKLSLFIATLIAARLRAAPLLSTLLGLAWFVAGCLSYSAADAAALGPEGAALHGHAVRNWVLWSSWIVVLAGGCAWHGRAAFARPWRAREAAGWALAGLRGLIGDGRLAPARVWLGLLIVMLPFFLAVTGRAPHGTPMMLPFRAVAIGGALLLASGLAPINRVDRGGPPGRRA